MGLDLNTALISDTFDGLIKTTDGNTLTGSPLVLTDGRGNDSSLALATAGNGVTITGTLTVGGVDIGGDLATAKSDITAIETKTDFITVTGAVNLDTIKTKADFITVTQAVDLDTIESDIASATAKTQYITVTQAVNLDTMESDILSAKTKTDFITISQAVNLDNVESGLATAEADIIAIEAKTDYITISSALNLNTVASNASAAKTKTDFLTVTQAVNLDTLESDVNTAKGDITAIEAKTDNITVTQAVNLDTMESDLASSKAKTDFITITQAVNLDTVESGLSQAQTDINLIEAKTNNITVTQAVNLDTMESDIATNNAKNSYPAGDATKVGFISVTQAVDLDSMETDISNLSANKYDKTGGTISGAVTITGDLTVNGTTTTVNTQTLSVKDPLIKLANDNSANSVDTGFYANYSEDAGVTTKYAGLFKDAGDSDKFKLFKGLEVEPTTTVNTAGTGYTKGDLVVNDLDAVTISGTLSTAAQTNITSVGTLSSLAVSGAATVGTNLAVSGALATGISTAASGWQFQAQSAGESSVLLQNTTTTGVTILMTDQQFSGVIQQYAGEIRIKPAGGTIQAGTFYASGDISFRDSSANEAFYWDASAASLGIGTTSPSANLDVTSTLGVSIDIQGGDGNSKNIVFRKTTGGTQQAKIRAVGDDLQFFTGPTDERMRIDSNGHLAIGTTNANPLGLNTNNAILTAEAAGGFAGNLQLGTSGVASDTNDYLGFLSFYSKNGGSGVEAVSKIASQLDGAINSTNLQFQTESAGVVAERMRIDSSGNVGIGTAAIGTNDKLLIKTSVDNSVEQGLVIQRSANTDEGYINYNGGAFQFRSTDGDPIVVGQVSNERMRIDSVGNVGIATASPAVELDVVGQVRASTGILFGSDTAAANALDDYEEGDWSPVYEPQTGSFATMTMDVRVAKYTKIGNVVTLYAAFVTDDVDFTGGSAALRLSGLPFTVGTAGGGMAIGVVSAWQSAPDGGFFIASSTKIQLRKTNASASSGVPDLTNGTIANQNELMISATYLV